MALVNKKYERIFSETGSDGDLITSDEKALMKKEFDDNTYINDKDALLRLGPVLYQLQLITEELDNLRTEISSNKNKTGITTSQANAIIANTAKTSMVIGKGANEAMAGNTAIPTVTVTSDSGLTVNFGNLKAGKTGATADLTITDNTGKSPVTYTVQLTLK